ncbi:MAG: hypothetical protein A2795_00290 [Caulobacterales bacterium RIFCSPHIGHO2_01_FULL_67_30]|nr:MAG: hypothetical protein A2795_00290 [Caulobacterales bacterium RIFCSPHIGHO2_01_FULL_67_30]
MRAGRKTFLFSIGSFLLVRGAPAGAAMSPESHLQPEPDLNAAFQSPFIFSAQEDPFARSLL